VIEDSLHYNSFRFVWHGKHSQKFMKIRKFVDEVLSNDSQDN